MNISDPTSSREFSPQMNVNDSQDADVIDLGALVGTLWRGKWRIAALMIIAILLGGYYAFVVATPLYRSTAVVILETDQQSIVDLGSVAGGLSGDSSVVNSEVEVLLARSLMGKVVDRLELGKDPEFNAALRAPSQIDEWLDQAKTGIKSILDVIEVPVKVEPQEKAQRTRDSTISKLLQAVSVRNVPQSHVFRITVETENGQKSAMIADAIVELYILNQIEVKFAATEQATVWLSERVNDLQSLLETAEAEVSAFSASTDLVSIEGMQALERQLKELRDRIDLAEVSRNTLVEQVAALERAETWEEQAKLADDTQLTRLLSRVETDDSFATAFEARLEVVVVRLTNDVARADQQLLALEASEIELTAELDQQGEDLITLQQLNREADASRVLYEYFLTRFNETSAQQGIQQADSRILSSAVVPGAASEPRKPLILALSGLLGLALGGFLVLLKESQNSGFRTGAELENATGYTVLGQIPMMPVSSRKKAIQYLTDKPMSVAAEAYRNMRTSLMLSQIDNPPKVIVTTSSLPGEGKTTNSIALAQNFIGMGKKVLLVEGDIRRRTLNEYFTNVSSEGIVSVMSGTMSLSEAVFRSPNFEADILAGEKTSTNAADFFSSDAFKKLIDEARANYDAVIIDTPPILVVPDARIIAQQADAVIFTVKWDHTSRQQVEESMRLFHNAGQRITGLILGQVSLKGMKKYGYGGKYGAYAGYGSKYYDS